MSSAMLRRQHRVRVLVGRLWEEPAQVEHFMRTPHAELGGKTPIELARTEHGARQVENIVMRALHGLPV